VWLNFRTVWASTFDTLKKKVHTTNMKTTTVEKSTLTNNDFLFIATSYSGYWQEKPAYVVT
jgi:hypothetical protein